MSAGYGLALPSLGGTRSPQNAAPLLLLLLLLLLYLWPDIFL
jgi:hypothetical protein